MSRQTSMTGRIQAAPIGADMLATRTGGSWHDATRSDGIRVSSIEIDSRKCCDGALFIALPGSTADGHDFIPAAAASGAAAALVAQPDTGVDLAQLVVPNVQDALTALGRSGRAAHRQAGGKLVAITGSVGKTGSKEMLAHGLNRAVAMPTAPASTITWACP